MKKTFCLFLLMALLFAGCSSGRDSAVKVTLDDLTDSRIGVLYNSVGTVYSKNIKGADITVYASQEELAAALLAGDVDYALTDYPVARNITVSNIDLSVSSSSAFPKENFVAAVRSEDHEIFGLTIVVLKELADKGTMDKLADGFIGVTEDVRRSNIAPDAVGENGTIVLGTSAVFPPFEYIGSDGAVCGLDIEIAKRIALKGGYTLEIKNMDFDSLLPALQAGEVDIVISGLSASSEYDESIGYTDPYYTCAQYIVYANR